MAYRKEGDEIVIDGWEKGIAPSPFEGISDMRVANINNIPGTVGVGFTITANSLSGGGSSLGRPYYKAVDLTSPTYYVLDTNGRVWSSSSLGGTFTYLSSGDSLTGAGQNQMGLVFWNGYLIRFRNDSIDWYSGGTWHIGWNPATGGTGATGVITGTTTHFAIAAQDDAIYFCNGQYVGSILARGTFDPTSTSTYTFNAQALQLPSYDRAISLAELGTTLLVGGIHNAIYPWDRLSPTYKYPIFLADHYMKRMVTANNNVYIFAGNTDSRGRIYITNGANAEIFYKFPDHLTGYVEPYFEWGDAIWHRNNLIFTFQPLKNSDQSVIIGYDYVWAIDCDTKALRSISEIGTSSGKALMGVLIGNTYASTSAGMGFIVGWDDLTGNYGIGYSGSTAGVNSLCIVKTDWMPVGTYLKKKTFENVELKLYSALASGESIIVTAVTDKGSSNVGTMSYSGGDTGISKVFPSLSFENAEWLYFQLSMTGNSETSGVRLREIRLRHT
jgi:hypothetical protein